MHLRMGITHPPARRLARVLGVAVPSALVAIAGVHAGWALGWRWPGGSDAALAERVLSKSARAHLGGRELPPAPLTFGVAIPLVGAAAIVATVGVGTSSRLVRAAGWGVSGVLLARGLVFLPSELAGGPEDLYERLDLAVYSPLCLALGAGTALVVHATRPAAPTVEAT